MIKQKINVLFVLLIFLMSSFVPMAVADGETIIGTETDFELIAVTTSNSSSEGTNFKFDNIEPGNYFILGGYSNTMSGVTNYTAITSVTVVDQPVTNANILGVRCRTDIANETFEIFDTLKSEIPAATQGLYSIEGTFQAPKMNADPVNQPSSIVLLIRAPVIMGSEVVYENEIVKIITTAYGADSVTISYKDSTNKDITENSIKATGSETVFESSINLEALKPGNNNIEIKVTAGDTSKTTNAVVYKTEEYKVIASTVSNESETGTNFKFENIEPGKYLILGGYDNAAMGRNYTAIQEIEITGNVNDAYILGERCQSDTANKTFEIFTSLKDENPSESTGLYSIEGTFQEPKMSAPPVNRKDSTVLLIQMPVIIDGSNSMAGDKLNVEAFVYGAEKVELEYINKTGDTVKTTMVEGTTNTYAAEIQKSELPTGYVKISIIATEGENSYVKEMTAINADPALLGVHRKVVIISGYETHNKIINELTEKYGTNGSNVEIVSLETKSLMNIDKDEIAEMMGDADVISIHMVSTTPTWDYLKSAIHAEAAKGAVILDDNSTRQFNGGYPGYIMKSVPGISDTDDNLKKYQAKVANYWSNTPYEHKNLENMINMILIDFYGRYDLGQPEPAVELPIKGIYHPHLENVFETDYDKYIDWYSNNEELWASEDTAYKYDPANPTVGITFYKSYYPDKMEPTAKLIEELEKKGVNVLAVYCEAPAYFDTATDGGIYFRKGEIDAVLNYRYIGEHRFDQVELDVPVFNILIVDAVEEWEDTTNPFGNSSMKLINQELIGAIDPIAVVSTEDIDGAVMTKPIIDQVDWMVERVIGQLNLQAKNNADKNVAVVYYNHGGGKGNIGASYLDVPASIVNLIDAMKSDDYNIDTSAAPDAETLVNAMITQGINIGGWAPGELKKLIGDVDISGNEKIYDTGKAVLISIDLYEKWFKDIYLGEWFEESIKTLTEEEKEEKMEKQTKLYEKKKAEVEAMWGTAPGNIMVYQNKYIIIPYIDATDSKTGGRVILTPQPARGHEESAETLYHDTNMPPTHQYIAFYLWLQNSGQRVVGNGMTDDGSASYPKEEKGGFGADAIIHMGRHGTQEWLPGKESALSRYDWPSVMAGNVPIIYPYIVDGVGEGIVAKRRGNAVLIDHMTPAIVYSGLYGDYADLGNALQSYETVEDGDVKEGHKNTIITKLVSTGLDARLGVTEEELRQMDETELEAVLHELEDILETLKTSYMPYGLHILGQALEGEALKEMVFAMLSIEYIESVTVVKGAAIEDAYEILSEVLDGTSPETAVDIAFAGKTIQPTIPQKDEMIRYLTLGLGYKTNLEASACEMDQILKGLRGGFIAPKVGGDPVSRPQVLPTGGNFYTIDQRRVPTKEAWDVAVQLTDQMLADYYKNNEEWPNSIGYVLWAGETTRTEGILEAQIMYLIGISPIWASGGNVDPATFEVIPAADLKVNIDGQDKVRPRIDVIVEISGVYRDTFPEKVLMLDRAIRLAYEQTDGDNNIRTNTDAIMSNGKYSKDEALSRIFGPAADSYGAGMDDLVGSSQSWTNTDQLAEHFLNRMGYMYNSLGEWGTTNDKELYKSQLANVDATVHSRSSPLYGALDIDDFYQYLGGLNAAVKYSREDGKSPDSYVMNLQTKGNAKAESLQTFIENEIYSTYMNPKWAEGMKDHGYAGARQIANLFDNLWGWEALDQSLISDRIWKDLYQHLLTGENGDWLKSNPQYAYSYQSSVARLIQAAEKDGGKYWDVESDVLKQLIKDYIDSVLQSGVACCHHTCGNPTFDRFIAGQMSVAGVKPEEQKEFLKILETATERTVSENAGIGQGSNGGGSARIVSSSEAEGDGEAGGGYGTEAGTPLPSQVSGYEMTTSEQEGTLAGVRDFLENPSISASSAIALALVALIVGAVFYGSRRKN